MLVEYLDKNHDQREKVWGHKVKWENNFESNWKRKINQDDRVVNPSILLHTRNNELH